MISPEQVRMARAALGWSVRDLASKVGVSGNTVSRFENGGDARGSTLSRVQRTFESEGITFLDDTGSGVGVRFKPKHSGSAPKHEEGEAP